MSLQAAGSSSSVETQWRHGVEVPGSAPASDAALQLWVDAAQWGFDNREFVIGNAAALRLWARACELRLHECYPAATEAYRLEKQAAMCREMLQHWHGQQLTGSFEEWHAQAQAQPLPPIPTAGASETTMAQLEARPETLLEYLEDERNRLQLETERTSTAFRTAPITGIKSLFKKPFKKLSTRQKKEAAFQRKRGERAAKIAKVKQLLQNEERAKYEDEWGF